MYEVNVVAHPREVSLLLSALFQVQAVPGGWAVFMKR